MSLVGTKHQLKDESAKSNRERQLAAPERLKKLTETSPGQRERPAKSDQLPMAIDQLVATELSKDHSYEAPREMPVLGS